VTAPRAAALAAALHDAVEDLAALIATIPSDRWNAVPSAGVWSAGKEAAHVAEALHYHQWIVHLTIGDKVPARKPVLERLEMTTDLTQAEMIDLVRERAAEGIALVGGLSDLQLDLTTRPPRAASPTLAQTIENVLIGHVRGHTAEITAKSEPTV
jgi:uncharacterized damage-inducible protein DinB